MSLEDKFGDRPLEILFVGHNPSEHSWESGHYFSQPSNRFWKLMDESGLSKGCIGSKNDDDLLSELRYGFTDVIKSPGASSNSISREVLTEQSSDFYKRISTHANQVKSPPRVIAFVGKRQFKLLFKPAKKKVDFGLQNEIPRDFPFECPIWVLSSPSGRAAMKWEDRLESYVGLAQFMQSAFLSSNIE